MSLVRMDGAADMGTSQVLPVALQRCRDEVINLIQAAPSVRFGMWKTQLIKKGLFSAISSKLTLLLLSSWCIKTLSTGSSRFPMATTPLAHTEAVLGVSFSRMNDFCVLWC